MKKIIIGIIVLVILLGVGASALYAYKPEVFYPMLSDEQIYRLEYKRALKLFPEQIGEYSLYYRQNNGGTEPEKIRIKDECTPNKDFCSRDLFAEYHSPDNNVVFIHLLKADLAAEEYKEFLEKIERGKVVIDSYSMFRIESHEIGWYPEKGKITMVFTQEGEFVNNPDGGTSYNYGLATGENAVTQHFLDKFPPARD